MKHRHTSRRYALTLLDRLRGWHWEMRTVGDTTTRVRVINWCGHIKE